MIQFIFPAFFYGLLFPISQQPEYFQWTDRLLPLTYGIDGIRWMMLQGQNLLNISQDVWVLVAYSISFMHCRQYLKGGWHLLSKNGRLGDFSV